MSGELVIARGYGGQPLKRVAVQAREGLIYIANPAVVGAVNSGDSHPIGFPASDVYNFDETAFNALVMEWEERGETDRGLWSKLTRYRYS
jgi:hypothetical protein